MRSTCGCGRPAGPVRSRPRFPRSRTTSSKKRGPGSTWRSPARGWCRHLRRSRRASKRRSARCCACHATSRRWRRTSVKCAGRSRWRRGMRQRWDLKYAAGGLIDIEFIAQYLQLVHAAEVPDILESRDRRRARQRGAPRAARNRGCRGAAPGGPALPGPEPDPRLALTAPFDPKAVSRESCEAARPRRGRAGFRRRSRLTSPRRRRACAAASCASLEESRKRYVAANTGAILAASGRRSSATVPRLTVERMRMAPP